MVDVPEAEAVEELSAVELGAVMVDVIGAMMVDVGCPGCSGGDSWCCGCCEGDSGRRQRGFKDVAYWTENVSVVQCDCVLLCLPVVVALCVRLWNERASWLT